MKKVQLMDGSLLYVWTENNQYHYKHQNVDHVTDVPLTTNQLLVMLKKSTTVNHGYKGGMGNVMCKTASYWQIITSPEYDSKLFIIHTHQGVHYAYRLFHPVHYHYEQRHQMDA